MSDTEAPTLRLATILDAPITVGQKGLPLAATGMRLRDLGRQGWNVLRGDVPLPACLLSRSALDDNRAAMAGFLAAAGVQLAPHGKTTMAPQLFQEQLADGAWGLTAATPAHLFAYRAVGVPRIFYANQLIDKAAIGFVIEEMSRDPHFECLSLVDSVAGARRLAEEAQRREAARPIDVLLEVGVAGKRCGVRTLEEGKALATVVRGLAPWLRLRGIEAFEGVISVEPGSGERVSRLLETVLALAAELDRSGHFGSRPMLSVGGSAFFGLVADALTSAPVAADLLLRSGCYLTSDHGMYAAALTSPETIGRFPSPSFRPALEVWCHVQSRPETDLAILAVGKRDISYDISMPIPVKLRAEDARDPIPLGPDFKILWMNDQHAALSVPADHSLAVGDLVGLGCSHPCTTFDKWRHLLVVDDRYDVIDVLATSF